MYPESFRYKLRYWWHAVTGAKKWRNELVGYKGKTFWSDHWYERWLVYSGIDSALYSGRIQYDPDAPGKKLVWEEHV